MVLFNLSQSSHIEKNLDNVLEEIEEQLVELKEMFPSNNTYEIKDEVTVFFVFFCLLSNLKKNFARGR